MVAPLSIDESPTLRTWTVSAPGHQPETLMAENWLTALGRALDALDVPPCTGRMAAEVLPNGVVIANDLTNGRRFVVQAG